MNTVPVEHEVYAAVGSYKLALIHTGHRSDWHRLLCRAGAKDALAHETSLARAEQHAKEVLAKSPAHLLVLEQIVNQQPDHVAHKDSLLSYLSGSIKP